MNQPTEIVSTMDMETDRAVTMADIFVKRYGLGSAIGALNGSLKTL